MGVVGKRCGDGVSRVNIMMTLEGVIEDYDMNGSQLFVSLYYGMAGNGLCIRCTNGHQKMEK